MKVEVVSSLSRACFIAICSTINLGALNPFIFYLLAFVRCGATPRIASIKSFLLFMAFSLSKLKVKFIRLRFLSAREERRRNKNFPKLTLNESNCHHGSNQ